MAKRKKKASMGAPLWVVTYGDLMSLLLCFFILLAAFSELKQDHEYQRVITAVKEAFGFSGGVGVMPTDDPPMRSMIQTLEEIAMKQAQESKVSHTTEQGISGRETKVTRVHDGLMFTIGGSLTFEPGSALLKEGAREELIRVAQVLQGRNNKIAIRGHAALKRLPSGSPFADLRDLSYARAVAVANVLREEGGILDRVLVLEALGATEPIALRRYSPDELTENRRVEVVMLESMISDYHADSMYTDEGVAGGVDSTSARGSNND